MSVSWLGDLWKVHYIYPSVSWLGDLWRVHYPVFLGWVICGGCITREFIGWVICGGCITRVFLGWVHNMWRVHITRVFLGWVICGGCITECFLVGCTICGGCITQIVNPAIDQVRCWGQYPLYLTKIVLLVLYTQR